MYYVYRETEPGKFEVVYSTNNNDPVHARRIRDEYRRNRIQTFLAYIDNATDGLGALPIVHLPGVLYERPWRR